MRNPGEDPYATAITPAPAFEIPGFRINGELGRGAFGVVYRAHDITLDRPVAIKVALVDEPSRRDEYIQEAQKAAKLSIDGVVPVYQVGRLEDDMPFVVQMLLEGGTLRDEMKRVGGIAPKRICELMIRIGQVVAQAHALGLIHRDLKPDNILLDRRGQPWVADFGLAINEADQRLHKGEKAGTPLYMAPEQIQGRAEWLDGRADIYALGIIFYELLVGRPPYSARTRQELEDEILHRDPKPLTQYLTGIPHEFDVIFRKCCAKQTNDRYANAMDLVKDLEEVHQSIDYGDVHLIESARLSHGFGSARQPNMSTRRNSARLTERNEVARPTPTVWLPWLALGVILLGATVYGALNYQSFFVVDGTKSNPPIEIPPTVPTRPDVLRVSQAPDSRLKTITEAVKLARPGESIFIANGMYEENLALSQDVQLIGEENPRPSIIYAGAGDTIAITNGARVTLQNLKLDNLSKASNTIHVQQGSATVENCAVFASSYNCVRAVSNSSVQLSRSEFRNGAHEAVYVEAVKSFNVDGCKFAINVSSFGEGGQHPYGIQAIQCSGRVTACTFDERGQRGIYWKDATGPVSIENNQFFSCDYPIQLDNVARASIQGDTSMVDCKNGIELKNSAVSISGLKMRGTGKLKSSGIRVYTDEKPQDQSLRRVSIVDSKIESFELGLHVANKAVEVALDRVEFVANETGLDLEMARKATLNGCTISKCSRGMLLLDCTAELKDCSFSEVQFSITQMTPFDSRGLICERTTFQFGGPNSASLILKAGSAEMKNSVVRDMGFVAMFEDSTMVGSSRRLDLSAVSMEDCPHGLRARATGVATVSDMKIDIKADPKKFRVDEKPPKTHSIIAIAVPS